MFGAQSIVTYSAVITAAAATAIGFTAMWSNPERRINRVFFSASLHVAVWLVCRHLAVVEENLQWVRVTTSIGALMHFHLWLIKETVVSSEERLLQKISRGRSWLIIGLALATIPFTEWFIPAPLEAHELVRRYGPGYYVYLVILILLFGWLCVETVQQFRNQEGVSRLELQLLLFGGSATALVIIFFMAIRSAVNAKWFSLLVPLVVLVFYAATVVAVTTSRVFNARQIFFVALHKVSLISLVSLAVYTADVLFDSIFSSPITLILTVGLSFWLASALSHRFDRWFQFYPEGHSARQAAYAVSQHERRGDDLAAAFTSILKGWGQTENAYIFSQDKRAAVRSEASCSEDDIIIPTMRRLHWVTPERLARERRSRDRQVIADFLVRKQIGAVVIEEGVTLSVLVGVGINASRRPFTYPQVTQLMELGAIIANALERAHFSAKVQHAEQLATVGLLGASLAHEIRNPLVAIKTFVQLLPTHYSDPAFRAKFFKLIGGEVDRIDQLTDQLLDLATPRAYSAQSLQLHPVLQSSLDLVAAKAAHRQIELVTDFQACPDYAYTDASAAKQVMLNLCFNAIQAIDDHAAGERWIKIATRNVSSGIEMLIADSGPGIAPEIRSRLFQPFQTTKSNGFGLGLAICSEILMNLEATITVDSWMPNQGATFRVTFPCQPLSS